MPPPEHYARHLRAAAEQADAPRSSGELSFMYRLREPVILVTEAKGREVFDHSGRLMVRLEVLARGDVSILQLRVGCDVLPPRSIAALEAMLKKHGWRLFYRAMRARRDIARGKGTKWAWEAVGEFLGFTWERSA